MDEQVADPDGGQDVGGLVLVGRDEPRRRHGCPGQALQIRAIEIRDLAQPGEIEHAADLVRVVVAQAETIEEDAARRDRHRALDLDADGLAEPSPSELLLDRHQEIVGLVLLDRQIRIPRDAEEVVLLNVHPGEEKVQIGLDDLVEQDESVRLDLEQAGQDLGHLDPREVALAGLRVAQADCDRQAQGRDVRKWVARIHRQRGQDRVDLVDEPLAEEGVMLGDRAVAHDLDVSRAEGTPDLAPDPAMVGDELEDLRSRGGELLGGRPAVRRRRGTSGVDLLAQPGDPDLEELVEHAREDRHEVDPLEDRVPDVARFEQHAGRVIEPGELAVDVRMLLRGAFDSAFGRGSARPRAAAAAFAGSARSRHIGGSWRSGGGAHQRAGFLPIDGPARRGARAGENSTGPFRFGIGRESAVSDVPSIAGRPIDEDAHRDPGRWIDEGLVAGTEARVKATGWLATARSGRFERSLSVLGAVAVALDCESDQRAGTEHDHPEPGSGCHASVREGAEAADEQQRRDNRHRHPGRRAQHLGAAYSIACAAPASASITTAVP